VFSKTRSLYASKKGLKEGVQIEMSKKVDLNRLFGFLNERGFGFRGKKRFEREVRYEGQSSWLKGFGRRILSIIE